MPFSTSDLDIDGDMDHDGRAKSDSEGPPRKIMRVDSSNSDPETSDRVHINPQSLAAASLRNPTDALNLLALAADVDRKTKHKSRQRPAGSDHDDSQVTLVNSPDGESDKRDHDSKEDGDGNDQRNHSNSNHHHLSHAPTHREPSLTSYALVKNRVLPTGTLSHLVNKFFTNAHAVFPMVPYDRIPRDTSSLARFASEEEHLLTAVVVIAARQEKMFDVHGRAWEYMQTLINELILGKSASVGAVEALLLLSGMSLSSSYRPVLIVTQENLPRRHDAASEDEEHRMGWMLVGMAVRIGYMLGLDQKTLRPLTPSVDDEGVKSSEKDTLTENYRLDRERLAWTCELWV
jgi:hypothetical protein